MRAQEGDWPAEMLQKYLAWSRNEHSPAMTPEAEEVLGWYYRYRRGVATRSAAQTTVRLLQSLVRLSQVRLLAGLRWCARTVWLSSEGAALLCRPMHACWRATR